MVLGRPELTGQALVSEVRRLGLITLSDAHALVALSDWSDRSSGAATTEAERLIVREAWMALDHAVPSAPPPSFAPPAASPYAPPAAPDYAPPAAPQYAPPAASASPTPRSYSPPPAPDAAPAHMDVDPPATSSHRRRLYLGLGALLLVAVCVAGGVWWYVRGRAERALNDGVAAYQRGAREVARAAFVQAAQSDPGDARPLVYLGRIAREEGDLARARRFLTNAVRLAPQSSIAARELASLMLADGQPEIARRFYVRAIQLDPADRTAQGFLGCALVRLQRVDEARRWLERAGPGDWQQCNPPMLPPGAPMAPPGYPPVPPP